MKKLYPYIVGLVIVGGLVGVFWFVSGNQENKSTNQQSSETVVKNTEESNKNEASEQTDATQQQSNTNQSYTKAEVATHNSESDCWTIISGSVYDITSYVPRHPGGDEIFRACGTDGTTLFTQRTTSDGQAVGSGEPHSSNAEAQLARLKIGTLSQ